MYEIGGRGAAIKSMCTYDKPSSKRPTIKSKESYNSDQVYVYLPTTSHLRRQPENSSYY
jgi:hypothetical protein